MASHKSSNQRRGRAALPSSEIYSEYDPRFWLEAIFNPVMWVIIAVTVLLIFIPVWLMSLPGIGSMGQSLVLSGFILLLALGVAVAVLIFGGATPTKSRLIALGMVVGGFAFSYFAFQTDYQQRVTTLFEVRVDGSMMHELSFMVEHPGVEHELSFWPDMPGATDPNFLAKVRVELRDAEGETVLEREERFEPRSSDSGSDWGSASETFTPRQGGRYTLIVTPLNSRSDIPIVHVRIVDPEKRDGQRVEGY